MEQFVSQSAEVAILSDTALPQDGPVVSYNTDLKASAFGLKSRPRCRSTHVSCLPRGTQAPIYTEVNADPKAWVHSVEWRKVLNGDPGAGPLTLVRPLARLS
jgi:hypothetical protein